MQRFSGIIAGLVCVFFGLSAGTASAQDQCRDILQNGTFQWSEYKENNYFQQIIYSRFLSSTYEQSKKDKALGFGVPVGEIVLGGDYSEAQFEQKKAQLRKENFQQITRTQEVYAAVSSGDERIVGAWRDCMNSRGGLSLRFEPVSPTEVFATLEWFPAGGVTQTNLEEDISLTNGATFAQGATCFKKDRPIVASRPCQATITLPSALTTLAMTVNAVNGSARAFLPPRIRLKRDTQPYPFTDADKMHTSIKRNYAEPKKRIELSAEQIAEGWRFDPSSAKLELERIQVLGTNYCKNEHKAADFFTFTYGFIIEGQTRGSSISKNTYAVCQVHPSIMMVRESWVPVGTIGSQ
jgi:hypothetical protein